PWKHHRKPPTSFGDPAWRLSHPGLVRRRRTDDGHFGSGRFACQRKHPGLRAAISGRTTRWSPAIESDALETPPDHRGATRAKPVVADAPLGVGHALRALLGCERPLGH